MTNEKDNVINENIKNVENISGSSRATSGTIVNNFRTGYRIQVSWNVNSQDIANNISNVTVKAQLVSTGSAYTIQSQSGSIKNGSLTINGSTYNFTFSARLRSNETKTVFTKTVDIPHNADGNKTFAISTTLGINVTLTNVYWGNVTASGNAALNSIPRTSSFSLNTSSGTIGSTQFTVNINRASSAFTHKVYYRFGSINWLGSSNATTSFSFTPSIGDCSQIPYATSGVGTIVVETWNGGTYIGTASQNITLYVPDSVKPSFSSLGVTLIEAGASSSFGYVKGKSKCKLSVYGATGAHGSSITSYHISGGGFSSSQWEFTTGTLVAAGNITFSAYIIDTRGRRSDTKTVTINVKDYINPVITIAGAYRCNSNGSPDDNGTYIKVHFEDATTDIAGNAYSNKIEYKPASSSSWINAGSYSSPRGMVIGNGTISTSSSYNVRITVSDSFATATKILDVAPAFVTIDFRRGGKGVAIGKASERDHLFEVAMETKLSGSSNCATGQNTTATTKVSDLNTLWKSGFYDCENASNSPFGGWNWILHAGHTNNGSNYRYGMQIAGQNGSNNFAMRTVNVNGSGQWNTLYHTGSPIDLPNNGGGWLYGATHGNIRAHKLSGDAFHPIISQTTVSDHKVALGGLGNAFGFFLYDANRTANGYDREMTFDLSTKNLYTSCRTIFNEWVYIQGNHGLYFPNHNGGWYMQDSTWLRSYADKNIYTGGEVQCNRVATRHVNALGGQNIDINSFGHAIALNCGSQSGIYVDFRPQWSGSKGTEPSFFNTTGAGWGYIGGSGHYWFRIYGSGGSVSDRNKKYHITKADCSEQYENVKALNLYNYRSVSDKVNKETGEIEEKVYRQDLMLGTMVDELPTETVFYDNESGDGKAVDMYSYTSMILGATKHLIEKVEDLELKLEKMEELLDGITNER